MNTMESMKREICSIVSGVVDGNPPIAEDQDLPSQGVHSVYMVGVLVRLEEHYGVEFAGNELSSTHFQSIDSIYQLIQRKLADQQETNDSSRGEHV